MKLFMVEKDRIYLEFSSQKMVLNPKRETVI
ncbi:hypothetical protein BCF50_0755 [Chryseobacterium daecheongense]|uniref:Uncharacterized protein n=1 Tax=Chryseobacterium daecheongense TaxID=192389 RepID=A0ABY2FZ05_9FLAO|nr:hypothetical protein BCF50_0755 [Chryseobacterium daecheongense]